MDIAKTLGGFFVAGALAVACSSSDESPFSGNAGDGAAGSAGSSRGGSASGGSSGSSSGSAASGGSGASAGSGAGGSGGAGGTSADAGADVSAGGSGASASADAGIDGPIGPTITCSLPGDACSAGSECCSSTCLPDNTCASTVTSCAAQGGACATPIGCCSLNCRGGTCQTGACVSDGDSCSTDEECCGQTCTNGSCQPLNNGACLTSGNACSNNNECCSALCDNGFCELRSSFCIQENDICAGDADCCSGRCDIESGNVGTCGPPPKVSAFCSDGQEGKVCGTCNDCCSRLCAEYGPTGVKICQPASGCHVTGDFCREDTDCCGGDDNSGLPGAGNVVCQKEPGSVIGLCRNPQSCSPQGNVCHYKDYACGSSSARNNCCGGVGNSGECQLDGLGVPRCNGLGTDCREPGETCASADDCCNDVPCVPDSQGVLRCLDVPDGGSSCVASGGTCTINADCCPGSTCLRPVGSTSGICGNPDNPPPPGDSGTNPPPDAGPPPPQCSQYGQQCSATADCCNSVPCSDGICRVGPA